MVLHFLHTVRIQFLLFLLLGIIVIFPLMTFGQDDFPPTISVPVTYFDFHSTGSCPDFNPIDEKDTTTKNMVDTLLDKEGLPVRGKRTYFSHFIENWFRPWDKQHDSTRTKKPVYYNAGDDNAARNGTLVRIDKADTLYKNIVFHDSIIFKHIGNGRYLYQNETFFPLDKKGFGNEDTYTHNGGGPVSDHNYSFTMMLKREFIYKPNSNMHFSFRGDDDVWVFIGERLAMDLGGIHMEMTDSFNLDKIATKINLIPFKKYTMSFFFAERQANSSHIWISTNMISVAPSRLEISASPNDTIRVGDTAFLKVEVHSDTGKLQVNTLPGKLSWTYIDPKNYNPPSTFTKFAGDSAAQFAPIKPYTTVLVIVGYDDDKKNIHLKDTIFITVIPGLPDHLVIEASPDMPQDEWLFKDHPLDTVVIAFDQMYNDQFYAILRDKNQNWIGPSSPTSWKSEDPSIIGAQQGPEPQKGQGKAVRATMNIADDVTSRKVTGDYDFKGNILNDAIVVKIYSRSFNLLRAYYLDTDNRPDGYIDLVRIVIDDNIKVADSMMQKLIQSTALPDHRNFLYSPSDGVVFENGFGIKVTQDRTKSGDPVTSTDKGRDIVKFTATPFTGIGIIKGAELVVEDSLAPVLTKALFGPKYIQKIGQILSDTLWVWLSEAIKKPASLSPFMFYNPRKGVEYTMNLSQPSGSDNTSFMFFVDSIINLQFPDDGDSIWIKAAKDIPENQGKSIPDITSGAVEDELSNYYKERPTKPITMTVRPYRADVEIKISGPQIPIPETVKNALNLKNKQGIVTIIQPMGGSKIGNHEKLSYSQHIFDPLGNVVARDLTSQWNDTWGVYTIEWDMTNHMGRRVYNGSFVFIIKHYFEGKYTGKFEKRMVGVHQPFSKDE
ncbi:MAG: fibro-slime domain-containing protein [Chitinivibrionales bacterium]|nr:fibro-slime domain-containing protein [Chitinivibrionales bacterium]